MQLLREHMVDCMNACLDIEDPATTVPELVAACAELIADYDDCISASEFGDGRDAEKLLGKVKYVLAKMEQNGGR